MSVKITANANRPEHLARRLTGILSWSYEQPGKELLLVPRSFRWNESAGKLQIPSSKLQAPEKFQAPNLNAPPWMATHRSGLDWELEIWSFPGAWGLELGVLVRAVFHRKHQRTLLHL